MSLLLDIAALLDSIEFWTREARSAGGEEMDMRQPIPARISRVTLDLRAGRLSRLVPTIEANHQDSLKCNFSKYANGIADNRLLHASRLAGYAGLFVVKYSRPEPQPSDSWHQAEDH